MLHVAVGNLRNVDEAVLVDADIDKCPKVNHISHRTLENHAGLEVRDIHDIAAENRSVELLTRVAAGLFKLLDDVVECVFADAELFSEFLLIDAL